MAGVKGRSGPKQEKPWRDAIRRAVARAVDGKKGQKGLDALADTLVKEGISGDVAAIREIGDRLDGKAAQAVTGEDGGAIEVVAKLVWAGK